MAINYDKYINSTGTHYISNSGGDENGGITGGKAGDQTGKEWQLKAWYNRPWTHVFRHPDSQVRRLIAELAIEGALNDKIGYDQNQRGTFWTQLKASGYRPANITTACEEDCSAGVNSIVKAVGYLLNNEKLKNVSSANTSRNTKAGLKAAGFEVLTESKYLTSGDYLLPGDILLYENHHVATNITKGKKATDFTFDVKAVQTKLISLGYSCGPDGADGDFGPNTAAAVKAFQKANNLPATSEVDQATLNALNSAKPAQKPSGDVIIDGCTACNIRSGPGTNYVVLGVAHAQDTFTKVDTNGWIPIEYKDNIAWISEKYGKLAK